MFARFFIDRPVFATVLSLVIVVVGLVAFVGLPVAQYPEIAPPTIQVTALYPGASAKVVAETVATPLEVEINGVERMLYMSSAAGNDGSMTLTITFELGTDLDQAQVLVQNRVGLAEPRLPEEVRRQGLTVKKRSPSFLLVVNMISPDGSRDQLFLSNYATLNIKDELARNSDRGSYLEGRASAGVAVFQRPGTNALEAARGLRATMEEIKKRFPPGVDYGIVYDTTVFIDESVRSVYETLAEAFVLVFLVVLVFLQDWKGTVLPMIDVPVSLIGTFAVMAGLGFTLNNLTLFGLVLAIGIVVDDAIVVLENIERWIARGLAPREATVKAMA